MQEVVLELNRQILTDSQARASILSPSQIPSQLSGRSLLVFLRHSGCTFCRETLAALGSAKKLFSDLNCQIVLIHLSSDQSIFELAVKYQIGDYISVSDPQKTLYQSVGLKRGRFMELLGPREIFLGVKGLIAGHGIGKVEGDPFQLAGVFLWDGKSMNEIHRAKHAGDLPNFKEISLSIRRKE